MFTGVKRGKETTTHTVTTDVTCDINLTLSAIKRRSLRCQKSPIEPRATARHGPGQIGSPDFRTQMAEALWLREVKASSNKNPLAQQLMIAFMASRVARLKGLRRQRNNINGLPEHVRTVSIVRVKQPSWQSKYIVFPPAYLSAVLGDAPIAATSS